MNRRQLIKKTLKQYTPPTLTLLLVRPPAKANAGYPKAPTENTACGYRVTQCWQWWRVLKW